MKRFGRRCSSPSRFDRGVTLTHAETKWVGANTGPEPISGTVQCPEGVHGPATLGLVVVVDDADSSFHAEIDYPVTVVCATTDSTATSSPTPEPEADNETEGTEDDVSSENPGTDD